MGEKNSSVREEMNGNQTEIAVAAAEAEKPQAEVTAEQITNKDEVTAEKPQAEGEQPKAVFVERRQRQADETVDRRRRQTDDEENRPQVQYAKILELALEIGLGLLSSGGSVSRVETAVDRICRAYSAVDANVVALPSMIMASIRTPDGEQHSAIKRVFSTSNNLSKLEKYNQLSRDVCREKYPVDDALKMCRDLAHSKLRNVWVTTVGASLVAGLYTVLFGGTIAEVLPAIIVALGITFLSEILARRSLNAYASTFLSSLLGGLLSVSICKLFNLMGVPVQCSYVMIGTIMILIPGLLTTNAVRDMFTGDLMSGTFLLLNGLLLAVVIAAGYGLSIFALSPIADFVKLPAFIGWYNIPAAHESLFKSMMIMLFGSVGSVAVCMFFNLNFKRMGWAVLTSVIALAAYVGMNEIFNYDDTYVFLIALVPTLIAAIISEILARKIKIPATLMLVPAIIAFVPGGSLYYTMEAMVSPNTSPYSSPMVPGVSCLLTMLGIAVGICTTTVIFHLFSPVFYRRNIFARKNNIGDPRKRGKNKGAKNG